MSLQYRVRRFLARSLRKTGALLESLSLSVLRQSDLERLAFDKYGTPKQIERWASDEVVDRGWNALDSEMLSALPATGRALVLFSGGGRDALAFAAAGYEVVASDAVAGMVESLRAHARRRGLEVHAVSADAEDTSWLEGTFDVVWIGCGMYSAVPRRSRRVAMLEALAEHVSPAGVLAVQFMLLPAGTGSDFAHRVRRTVGVLTGGFSGYEPGDVLWRGGEYLHAFRTTDELLDEAADAGLVEAVRFDEDAHERLQSGVVLRRRADV